MATRVQRIKVGIFLLVGGGIIVAGTLAMSGYQRAPQTPYWMEFNESVLGLNVGAVVEYLGVPVGQVTAIGVTDRNSARVDVVINDNQITLREGVRGKLVMFSLATGVMYISLSGGESDAPSLPPYSEIPTVPALISSLVENFNEMQDEIMDMLRAVSVGLEGMESGDLTRIINRTEDLIAGLDNLVVDLNDTVLELRPVLRGNLDQTQETLSVVSDAAGSVSEFFETAQAKIEPLNIEETNAEFQELLKSLNGAVDQMKSAITSVTGAVEAVVHESGNIEFSVRESLRSMVEALESMKNLTEYLRDDPGSVVRGRGTPRER